MILDGRTVPINWNYIPQTAMAIKWNLRSDSNYRGSDRGAGEDVYRSNVLFTGTKAELIDFDTALNDNRRLISLTLNDGEEIFGADVDHSGALSVIATVYQSISQISFKVFQMGVTLRLENVAFKTTTPDFSILRTASHNNSRQTIFELQKMFTYDQAGFVIDHLSNDGKEAGIFKAQFQQNRDEMSAIRRYLTVTARATKIAFPTFGGITQPFGPRGGSLPMNCRVIDWQDMGRQNYCDWNLSITFARDLDLWNQ